ncbi:hypothetical protein HEK616_40430 [Streptomyces nigrescens]|uniref:Transposase n=1 Tax=Streptomyces nigrescens TaxID=1920 RepID=A0ABM7ZW25_STRNI|nr:hypothetical protein [Streptomyces nigrescens]BDM70556.1 hypothetical protein HEK616_40430 [Streptomyces nigrescens]
MSPETMKRTFLRTHRYGMGMQRELKRLHGQARNYRSPQGRELIASNRAYLSLHPEWRQR